MKLFALSATFLILSCFSCQKQKFQSCSEYEKLVGDWRSIDGDLPSQLKILPDGKVILHSGVERGVRFKASNCFVSQNLNFNYYETSFKSIQMNRLGQKDKVIDALAIGYNATFDTILKLTAAFNPVTNSLPQPARFIRK